MVTKEVISKVADLVRTSLNLTCPYNPEEAVQKLGGKIIQENMNMAMDAYIKKEGEDSFTIYLNAKKSFLREKFTIAHELGHLFLHMGFLINKQLWNSITIFEDSVYYRKYERMSGNYNQEESEANEFAASFLMPRDEFGEQIYLNLSNNKVNIINIAHYFGVSTSAALTRAKWLRYVDW